MLSCSGDADRVEEILQLAVSLSVSSSVWPVSGSDAALMQLMVAVGTKVVAPAAA